MVLEKIRARADVISAQVQPDGCIAVTMKGEAEARIACTDNLSLMAKNTDLSEEALDHFVGQVTTPLDVLDQPPPLSTLRPALRATATLDAFDVQLATWKEPTSIIRRPFAADITLCFVFDVPSGLRYATQSDLKKIGITEDALAAAAARNFDALTGATRWSRSGNAMIAELDGNFELSLLTLDDLWPEIEKALGGPIVVGVPARDSVVAVRVDDADALEKVRQAMRNTFAHPISSQLLMRKNSKWVEFK